MSEQHMKAGQVDEAEEVFDVVLPSGYEAAEVVHPREETLHLPAPSVAAQLAPVLTPAPVAPVGRDHLDVVLLPERAVERVRVVAFVTDEPCREFVDEASGQNVFHKLALGRRSAVDRYGERKTVTSGDSDDFRTLAAPGGTNSEAPFLALAKVASTNASSRFSFPRWGRCRASRFSASSSFRLRTHCWNRRWQVWYGGYFSGISRHCAPVPRTQSTPFSTARVSCHGRPRLSTRRDDRSTGSTSAHCWSFSSQRPVTALRGHSRAAPGSHKFRPSGIYETGSRIILPLVIIGARGKATLAMIRTSAGDVQLSFSVPPVTCRRWSATDIGCAPLFEKVPTTRAAQ
jgi:hypothetical protein